MSKRRKRRRLAWINRFNEVIKENPGISTAAAKQKTEQDVRSALLHADKVATTREQHQKIFEETLSNTGRAKTQTTTTQPTLTKVEPAPKRETKITKEEVVAKASETITKPQAATPKTTTTKKPTAKKATTAKKPATAKKTTTTKKTTTRKRTTTTKTKKS